jgi:serine/threonine protein kinase
MNSTLPSDPERYRRLRELVDRAAERPAAEWVTFLERECPTDPALQEEALRLLGHAQAASAEGFLEPSAPTLVPGSVSMTQGEPDPGSAERIHVGKYRLVRRFSAVGGQAAAYLAFDPDVDRHVVLKRYHGPSGEAEEGRALAKVNSPYVARCHGVERIDGAAFLVVEYIPGRNLAEVRRDGPLGLEAVVRILAQLAEGVAAVHARGLIHRDIKPANVILHDDGTPRLVDFGLAAYLGSDRLRERGGSLAYMAPEQARGEWDRIDFRADIFGLGAVLYQLLTGRAPYAGSTLFEALEQAKKADVTPPRRLEPAIPAPLEAVCLKALAAAPENRYTTPLEFAAALRQAVEPAAVGTPPSARLPARVRWGLPGAVVACGLVALAAWLWHEESKTASPVAPAAPSEPAPDPLQARIEVQHFKDSDDHRRAEPQGMISETSLAGDPPRFKDLVRVHVSLSRPAYAYLIVLNPNGRIQLGAPAGGIVPRSPRAELVYPEEPKKVFHLTDGVGLLAFVVVASDRPLPEYESWKAQVPGGLAWSPVDGEGFWTYDSCAPSDAARFGGMLRGEVVERELAPEALVDLCDRLRRSPGVTLVHAVAFPVKSHQDIIK